MNKIIEKIKKIETPMLIIVGACLICLGVIIYGLFFSGSDDAENITNTNNLVLPEDKTPVTDYESKIDAYEAEKRKDKNDLSLDFQKGIFTDNEDTEAIQDSINDEERLRKLEEQIAGNNDKQVKKSQPNKVYGDYSMWNSEPKTETKNEQVVENNTSNFEERIDRVAYGNNRDKGKKSNDPYDFNNLSEAQKRQVLFRTGQSHYQESSQIEAVVISSGSVRQGQTVTFMTTETGILSLEKIPKGTTISGIASFNQNRLMVQFSTMRLRKSKKIIKVNLQLYGQDGLAGLPVNGDLFIRETEESGIDEAVQRTGKVGRVLGSLVKNKRSKEDIKVELGRDIPCVLVNMKSN